MLKRRLASQEPNLEDDEDDGSDDCGDAAATYAPAVSSASSSTSARTERRRKQCRISQRRYRDKKGSAEYNLRLDINSLRESVERLKQARGLLEHKIALDRRALRASVLKAVEQYFAMFQFGLHDPHAGAHVRKCYDIQVSFLRAFLDPQIECGGDVGVEHVLEQWRRYSRYHSTLRVELLASEMFGSDSESPIVKATGTLTVTLNRATLEHVFPHVLADERLAQRLVDQQVAYTTCTEFVFDEKVQVVRLDFTVDFLAGLGAVLRDPLVTAAVLKQARISHSSHLGLGPDDDDADGRAPVQGEEEEHEDDDPEDPDAEEEEEEVHPAVTARASAGSQSASTSPLRHQYPEHGIEAEEEEMDKDNDDHVTSAGYTSVYNDDDDYPAEQQENADTTTTAPPSPPAASAPSSSSGRLALHFIMS